MDNHIKMLSNITAASAIIMSQKAEIQASVAVLIKASILYLAMIDDNKSKNCVLYHHWLLLIDSQSEVCVWLWVMDFWSPLLYLASELF